MKRADRRLKLAAAAPDTELILTLQEAADFLHCHYSTLYRLVRRGAFPAFLLGSEYRVRRVDIAAWIAQQRAEPKEGTSRRGPHKRRP
jgi:excisionase family DNA binding protein